MIKYFGGEYSVNKKESHLKSTKDILDFLNLPYTHVAECNPPNVWNIQDVIRNHKDSLTKDDLIIFDDFCLIDATTADYDEILHELKDLSFLIFCYDIVSKITEGDLYYNITEKNYRVISPCVFDTDVGSFNYYAWNYTKSDDLPISKYLFDSFSDNLKDKKFIAPFGFLRWDRFLTYQSLLKNNNLNDGYVSFSMNHNYGEKNWNFLNDQILGFDAYGEIDKNLLEETKKKIPFSFDRNRSEEYIKKYSDNSFTNKNSRLELLYRHNSYVGIVNDTQVENKIPFYTSEKLWKPFLTFQFPFIIGNSFTHRFLKNLGLDLFDDIFEMDITDTMSTVDLIKVQLECLNKFLSKDKLEIDSIYQKNKFRLIHNFEKIMEYGNSQQNHLKTFLYE